MTWCANRLFGEPQHGPSTNVVTNRPERGQKRETKRTRRTRGRQWRNSETTARDSTSSLTTSTVHNNPNPRQTVAKHANRTARSRRAHLPGNWAGARSGRQMSTASLSTSTMHNNPPSYFTTGAHHLALNTLTDFNDHSFTRKRRAQDLPAQSRTARSQKCTIPAWHDLALKHGRQSVSFTRCTAQAQTRPTTSAHRKRVMAQLQLEGAKGRVPTCQLKVNPLQKERFCSVVMLGTASFKPQGARGRTHDAFSWPPQYSRFPCSFVDPGKFHRVDIHRLLTSSSCPVASEHLPPRRVVPRHTLHTRPSEPTICGRHAYRRSPQSSSPAAMHLRLAEFPSNAAVWSCRSTGA